MTLAKRNHLGRRGWLAILSGVVILLLAVWMARHLAVSGGLFGLWTSDATWEGIQRGGNLRVAMDASYPPFEDVTDEGQIVGLDADLARALAQRWGVQIQLINIHFDGLYDALEADKCDLLISALPYDRMLTQDVLYSTSYFDAGQVLVAAREGLSPGDANALAGLKVAVELGSEGHQLLRQLQRDDGIAVEILAERTADEALVRLEAGEADLLLCDRVMALTWCAQRPGLRLVEPALSSSPYVIAAPIEARQLAQEVNQALAEWQADGTLATMERRWFEQ